MNIEGLNINKPESYILMKQEQAASKKKKEMY